jgi:hypothetical protein
MLTPKDPKLALFVQLSQSPFADPDRYANLLHFTGLLSLLGQGALSGPSRYRSLAVTNIVEAVLLLVCDPLRVEIEMEHEVCPPEEIDTALADLRRMNSLIFRLLDLFGLSSLVHQELLAIKQSGDGELVRETYAAWQLYRSDR